MDKRTRLFLLGAGAALAAGQAIRRARAYDLRDKVVLITGGSRGLGLEMARAFAKEGAQVAICARDTDELERAREGLTAEGADVLAVPCDITDQAQVEALIETVQQRLERVDVLVNNAGVIQVGPEEEMTLADYQDAMNIYFWGPLYAIRAALPAMRACKAGRIVNIASIGGKISVPHLLPYSAGKFALVGLSEGLRAALRQDGVIVTTICPGLMRTGSPRNALFKGQNKKEYAWFSISDSLPGISMSSARAARQIVAACKAGAAERVLSLPAQVGATVHALFPGLTADALGLVARALPGPGGIGKERATGAQSQSSLAPSWLTALGDRAAQRNNETEPSRSRPERQDHENNIRAERRVSRADH